MFDETLLTLEEVGERLKVHPDVIRAEISLGRLKANDIAGHIRIRESALYRYLEQTQTPPKVNSKLRPIATPSATKLYPSPDFEFTWPNGKKEQFADAHEGVASYEGIERQIKIGFTVRTSAGKERRRSLVLIDRYATVEFVAGDAAKGGRMASIIKDRNGKQRPAGGAVPQEYQSLKTGPYRDVVDGPGAPNGLSVVCDATDLDAMVHHALIRYGFRESRTQIKRIGYQRGLRMPTQDPFQSLSREIARLFADHDNSENFIRILEQAGNKVWDFEGTLGHLPGPGGAFARGQRFPTNYELYNSLTNDKKTELNQFYQSCVNRLEKDFPDLRKNYFVVFDR